MDVKDGVHFGLPEEVYHAIPALSASGIKNLLIHPGVFWANSWMNPLKEDDTTDDKVAGKAYHKRILEGHEAFYTSYASHFECDDEDVLRTSDDISSWLANAGLAKTFRNKSEGMERIRSVNQTVLFYDVLKAEYERLHDGKTFISQKLINRIELAAAMIEKNPDLARCFQSGMPEVTVVWTADGVRYKARFDYLQARAISDLKTFDSFKIKSYDRMVYEAMASYKYHIQGSFYGDHAYPAMRMAVAEKRVFYHGNNTGEVHRMGKLIHDIASLPEDVQPGMYFVFQLKNPYPIATGRKLPRTSLWQSGLVIIEQAIEIYKKNLAHFGTDPWVDTTPIEQFEDDQFPAYINDV